MPHTDDSQQLRSLYLEWSMLQSQIEAATQDLELIKMAKDQSLARIAAARRRLKELQGTWFSPGQLTLAKRAYDNLTDQQQ